MDRQETGQQGGGSLKWPVVLALVMLAAGALVTQFKPELAKPETYRQAVSPAVETGQARSAGHAPVLKKGKPVKVGKKLMANWVATGAGDATYNGTYVENGTYNGSPCYNLGAKWLWKTTPNWWLGPTKSLTPIADGAVYSGNGDFALPDNPWNVVGTGTAPAPTLAAESWWGPGDWFDGPYNAAANNIRPCDATLGGVDYTVFAVSSPEHQGFMLYRKSDGKWGWCEVGAALWAAGQADEDWHTGMLVDAGDGGTVHLVSGVYIDGGFTGYDCTPYTFDPGVDATAGAGDAVTLASENMSAPAVTAAGVIRYMLVNGATITLRQYTCGDAADSTIATYASGTGLPAGYAAVAFDGTTRPDHALLNDGGTLYWSRRCEKVGESDRFALYEVDAGGCTAQGDVVEVTNGDVQPGDRLTQGWSRLWATLSGEIGKASGSLTAVRLRVGEFVAETTNGLLPAYVIRSWPTTDEAFPYAGWTDLSAFVAAAGAAVELVGGTGVGRGVADAAGLESQTPVDLDGGEGVGQGVADAATLQSMTPVDLTGEGIGQGVGEVDLRGVADLREEGVGRGVGEVTLESVVEAEQEGPGGYGELVLTPGTWPGATRRTAWPGYFTRMSNRRYGGPLGFGRPSWHVPVDETNELAQYVYFWSWMSEYPSDQNVIWNVAGNPDTGVATGPGAAFSEGDIDWGLDGLVNDYALAGQWAAWPMAGIGQLDFTVVWDYVLATTHEAHELTDMLYPMNGRFALHLGEFAGGMYTQLYIAGPGPAEEHFYEWAYGEEMMEAGRHRVILSCDRDGLACVYHNGIIIGDGQDISATALSNFLTNYGVSSYNIMELREMGILTNYAATAADVATNPGLATPYGFRGSTPLTDHA